MNGRVNPVQLFQQPNAGTAMDMRYVKGNNGNMIIFIIQQFSCYTRLIQVTEPFISACSCCAGVLIILVIVTQAAARQYLVYILASLAAKLFIIDPERCCFAFVAAMVARGFYKCAGFPHII